MNDPKYDIYRSAPIIKAPKNIQFGGGNNRKSSPKTSNFSGSFFFQAFVLGFFLVMASASGKIFFKQMTNKMPNYPFFLSIFIVLMGIPFYYIIYLNLEVKQAWDVAIQKKGLDLTVNKEVDELYWESRKKRGFQFSKKKLFVMGILDSFAGLLMVFGGKGTSGTLQTLLFQAVIPLTMVLAIVFLKERYTIAQYLGSFGVVLGVFVSFIPSLMDNSNLIYVLVYLSAVIPTAVSSIYKEHTLKKMFVNMFYLQAWVSFYQFIASFLFLPINCIPVIGGIDFIDIPKNIYQGALCFIGIPSRDGDDCHWVYLPILGYTLANFLFNLLSLYILKNLSSAIVYIQNTVRLPLVAIAFHIPLIMGDDTIPWGKSDYYTFGGLAFIVAGLLLYMKDAVKKKSTSTLPLINEHSMLLPESIEKFYHSAPLPTLPNNNDVLGIDPENIRSVFMG